MKRQRHTYRWLSLIALTLWLALLVAPYRSSEAQISEQELLAQIEAARKQGVVITDQQVNEALGMVRQYQRNSQSILGEPERYNLPERRDANGEPKPPISHVRGAEGLPFPKPEDIVYEALPTHMPYVETPAPEWSPVPYKRPGRCESNSTQRVPLYPDADTNPTKKEGDPDEKELLYDYLFIAEDLVPYDSTEVFGLDTVLRPYGPKSGEAVYTRMEIYNVPCVPYRIRMTNKAHYYDTGLNALKNYDGRHSGVGVLSKWMTLKLYGAR